MIEILRFEKLFEMALDRFREIWADDGEEFNFVALFQLCFLSTGYSPGPIKEQMRAASGRKRQQ
jgi:hypothetical protein